MLQLCVYSERVAALQGLEPEKIHVVTGDGETHAYRLQDFQAYYRAVKSRFETTLAGAPSPTYPEPVDHCRVCRWYPVCAEQRKADDHLSRVANITRRQTAQLVAAGVPTLTALAERNPARTLEGMAERPLARLTGQARLQLRQYGDGVIRYEWVEAPDAGDFGLAHLPAPSPGDVFLDLEADPWIVEGGLEYLVGALVEEDGRVAYHPLWAHSREEEKAAFDRLMDLVMARLEQYPEMHVFHYGAYEDAALKRLMSRHAIRQDDLDRLLRRDVLVDLNRVLVGSMQVSEESYSLKKIEKLYWAKREGPVTRPGYALVQYERWIDTRDDALLADLQAYNRDDCLSIEKLRAWLEERRVEWEGQTGLALPRPEIKGDETREKAEQIAEEIRLRVEALTHDVPAEKAARTDEQQARWLLAQLLEFHRREEKPQWWLHFDHLDKSDEELFRSGDALVGLREVGVVAREKRSTIVRYAYDPAQEHSFKVGDEPYEKGTKSRAGEVRAVDRVAGTIDLLRGPSKNGATPDALTPPGPLSSEPMRKAIQRVVDSVLANRIDGDGPYRAVRDLLLGRPPRIAGIAAGASIARAGESTLDAALRVVTRLEETCLPIQGPPGTGKTYTGARMILALVREGQRVGIAASAHAAITNMLDAVCDAADEAGVPLRAIQKADEGVACGHARVDLASKPDEVASALARGTYHIAAGTAWLFAREDMAGLVDVLFVDEAGQMSLANVVGMGGAASSIVFLGDPNQLPQVSQGTHPEGAEASALEHVLARGGHVTLPPSRGLFLNETRRMHPDVCRYISEAFYEGRLDAHASTEMQRLHDVAGDATGVHVLEVAHDGCSVRSEIEARRIADLVERLLGGRWTNEKGDTRRLTLDDIVIVAPYNVQVAEIARTVAERVGGKPRVGTVDRFQGQEAAVAIYSMTTSTPEDAPRQMDFLFSSHRLNVALSRARCLAFLVGNPRLLEAHCRTPEQMRLLNAFCRLREMAGSVERDTVFA